jgi:hypothetical protein
MAAQPVKLQNIFAHLGDRFHETDQNYSEDDGYVPAPVGPPVNFGKSINIFGQPRANQAPQTFAPFFPPRSVPVAPPVFDTSTNFLEQFTKMAQKA